MMKLYAIVSAALTSLQFVQGHGHDGQDILKYVDPLIGTVNGGHVFAGASLPFGMAKAVADVGGENQAGYGSDNSPIIGFSHMHDSGTGGVSSMGNFPIFPFAACPDDNPGNCKYRRNDRGALRVNETVVATPGYFAVTLETQIKAEMTVSNRTALYRFTFPDKPHGVDAPLSPAIFVELDDLPKSRQGGEIAVDNHTGRIGGNASFTPSFGTGQYKTYFCMNFKGLELRDGGYFGYKDGSDAITWADASAEELKKAHADGGFARFKAPANGKGELLVRVGVSFMSTEQACQNAEKEVPDWDFAKLRDQAADAWAEKLGVIEIDDHGADKDLLKVFWSGIYRNFLSPQDYTGENPLWQSDEPYYDSWYCIWDSYRAQHPLLTIMDPETQTLMVRSLIDIYKHEGKLPDCRMSLCKGWTQGGSNADVVLGDAYMKGLHKNVNWTLGYEALVSDAEVVPSRWDVEGRGDLKSWREVGYVPVDARFSEGFGVHTRSISRTVEYAYDDFCIGLVARGLGNMTDYEKYMNRSGNWENLYKADQNSTINGQDTGFTGFLQPRKQNGDWDYQDPILCSPLQGPDQCYLTFTGHETYEGSCWLYTFYVPGDMARLVEIVGGKEAFVKRLDYFHESGLLYMGDEQGFLDVFLYHYAGRPGLSSARAHYYIPSQFNTTKVGIPGNDDSGAMGSFAAFTMMGLYPSAGQNMYFITAPFFREVKIRNAQTGNVAVIKAVNFDPSYKKVFIKRAKLNGAEYTKSWIDHGFFVNGGVLELWLDTKESDWGTKDEDLPPSLSTTGPPPAIMDFKDPPSAAKGEPHVYQGLFGAEKKWSPLQLLSAFFFVGVVLMVAAVFWREVRLKIKRSKYIFLGRA